MYRFIICAWQLDLMSAFAEQVLQQLQGMVVAVSGRDIPSPTTSR
jgi:hypothetical protein